MTQAKPGEAKTVESGTPKQLPKAANRPPNAADAYGVEGTNKTLPTPLNEAQPSAELQGTKSKFIPNTPYTRG